MLRLNFEKKYKIKSLMTWSISEGRVDQKQIINFVRPYTTSLSYLTRLVIGVYAVADFPSVSHVQRKILHHSIDSRS